MAGCFLFTEQGCPGSLPSPCPRHNPPSVLLLIHGPGAAGGLCQHPEPPAATTCPPSPSRGRHNPQLCSGCVGPHPGLVRGWLCQAHGAVRLRPSFHGGRDSVGGRHTHTPYTPIHASTRSPTCTHVLSVHTPLWVPLHTGPPTPSLAHQPPHPGGVGALRCGFSSSGGSGLELKPWGCEAHCTQRGQGADDQCLPHGQRGGDPILWKCSKELPLGT